MTREEFLTVEAQIAAYWPTQPIPDAAFDAWFEVLEIFPVAVVIDAVKLMYVEGSSFPPNAGQIHKRIMDTQKPADFDAVLSEVRDMLRLLNRNHRFTSTPTFRFNTPDAGEWSSPAIALLVHRAGGINQCAEALGSWCGQADDTTFIAQLRGYWQNMTTRQITDQRIAALEARNLDALALGAQPIGEILREVIDPEKKQAA